MKKIMFIAFLSVMLAACAPAQPNATAVKTTTSAAAGISIALTQTALPIATFPLPTVTSISTDAEPTPSLVPTQPPIPILTPDAIQIARWKEYQAELAKIVLIHSGPIVQQQAACEWDVLGKFGQEVYVWAYCAAPGGEGAIASLL